MYDVNIRYVLAYREIGKGHAAMETVNGYMNMPPPMAIRAYTYIVKNVLHDRYVKCAKDSMQDAALEIRKDILREEYTDEKVVDVDISADGTWQKRGYASLNGAVTIISIDDGKCLAFEYTTKRCKGCEMWEGKQTSEGYDKFIATHECAINYEGSAGVMEAVGVVRCFNNSIEDNKLRYKTYIGDDDTKSYREVVKADPYPGMVVEKGECIGHIQKRVGSRLRRLKKEHGKEILKDDKCLNRRIPDKAINRLQNYFGIAIRKNTRSLHAMKKAVNAVVYHCSESYIKENRHTYCPTGPDKWCKYQKAKKTGEKYEDKPGLPVAVRDKILPDLSSHELSSKCLHGKTQNNNEALNAFIWKRLPKDICWKKCDGNRNLLCSHEL